MEKINYNKILDFTNISNLNTLMKLRFIIALIFTLSTIAIILVFITDFFISVIFILFSYLMVFGLLIKLFTIKNL